jgi:hypothetical protein
MILVGPDRWHGVATMFGAAMMVVILIFGGFFAVNLQFAGLERLALESKDLIHAIKTFEAENDAPPPNLEALVPKYFATLPTPRLARYREYDYNVFNSATNGSYWKLSVEGVFLLDEFFYIPNQNYCRTKRSTMDQNPKSCGSYQMIGDWVYFRD